MKPSKLSWNINKTPCFHSFTLGLNASNSQSHSKMPDHQKLLGEPGKANPMGRDLFHPSFIHFLGMEAARWLQEDEISLFPPSPHI